MSGKWHGGKGSAPRPVSDRKQFEDNWDLIFGKKDKHKEALDELAQEAQDMGLYDSKEDKQ